MHLDIGNGIMYLCTITAVMIHLKYSTMRIYTKIAALALAAGMIAGFVSCERPLADQAKGKFEIALSAPENAGILKSALNDSIQPQAWQALVSVKGPNGNLVMEDELVPLYAFGNGFVSNKVELPAGECSLVKFMIISPNGVVVYASPLENAPLAYLVQDPLPLNFNILPGETTRIVPEVLAVNDQPPSKFGYASFSFQVVKPLLFYTVVILDNPLIMTPYGGPDSSGLAPILLTSAKLTVINPTGWNYSFNLEPRLNKVLIRGGSEYYSFILEKEGYDMVKYQFSARELMATSEDNPLVLKIGGNPVQVLTLQPGPEMGVDAMISNLDPEKNFGDHKYFEATFLSEPILTVMRSNRSLMRFNLGMLPKSATIKNVHLTLWYDIPIPWDTLYYSTDITSGARPWFGAVLQQVVEPWDEYKVTWNNQPKTVEANQVYVSPFIKNANFITLDVTSLYVPVEEVYYPNYGMMFRLYPNEEFPGFRFASSDYPDPRMRPMLSVYYTLP